MEKYYSNPFADDDDEACYAQVDLTEYEAGTPSRQLTRQPSTYSSHAPTAGASPVGLQRQLEEAHATNQALHAEYDTFITSLRGELEGANARNNDLLAAQTKLESRLRAATNEKDTAEWALQQERNRAGALEQRLGGGGGGPAPMATRNAPRQNYSHDYSQQATQAPANNNDQFDMYGEGERTPMQQPQRSSLGSNASGGYTVLRTTPSPPNPQYQQPQHQARMPVTRREHLERQKNNYQDPNSGRTRASAAAAAAAARPKVTPSANELNSMLLYHNRRRDDLSSELLRLDGPRRRTTEDRRRRETIEQTLDEEERKIGHIRLLMRNQTAAQKR